MSLAVEETDAEGRTIFFKSPADISKAVTYDHYDVCTQERVNELFEQKKTPSPKFCGFVYSYAPFLTICSSGSNGKLKVKQRIDYKSIREVYPCELDSNVLFIVTRSDRGKTHLRVLRLPSDAKATKLRYTIDQLQLTPLYNREKTEKSNRKSKSTAASGYSSLGTEADSRNYSTTVASRRTTRTAHSRAFDTVTNYYQSESQFHLPRVRQYSPRSMSKPSPKSRTTQTVSRPLDYETDFDDIQIYRPESRAPHYEVYSKDSSGGQSSRQRAKSRMQRHRLDTSTSSSDWQENEDEDSGFGTASRYRPDSGYSRVSRLQQNRNTYQRTISVPPRRYRVSSD
ncbi:hypothetical protein SprV_0100023400 [Sparganum proliferum]